MSQKEEKVVDAKEEEAGEGEEAGTKGLSKGQLKKLKEKKKKQEQAARLAKLKEEGQAEPEKVEKGEQTKAEGKQEAKGKKGKKEPKLTAAALLAKKKQEEQQKFEEEQERLRLEHERKVREEEERIKRQQEEKKKEEQRRINEIRAEIKRKKKAGMWKKGQTEQQRQMKLKQLQLNQKQLNKDEEEEEDATEEEVQQALSEDKKKKQEYKHLQDDRLYFARKEGDYRSPVCCILGHVDTGKTTLLDKIRRTNVQENEAGGITQQIGATFFPHDKLVHQVSKCDEFFPTKVDVPGLLIIDTPGHESFSNLRSRGSSLCDIAILVIDLQHGLQNQTIESLELLAKQKTPFVVALNKIDRSYNWKPKNDGSSYLSLKEQKGEAYDDYRNKSKGIIMELNAKGYNVALYWENEDPSEYISLVPTSGITGEGIPDLLACIVKYSLTLENIQKRIKVKADNFRCTVMEVKMIEGYGTTIDCMLVDGRIKRDDTIVVLGFEGPIVTKIKALLTPHPMKQMRIKDEYIHHKQIWGANGVKVAAPGLDNAVAGTPLIVANTEDQIEDAKAICLNEFENIKKKIKLQNLGVGVAASTLGSLQALLMYLKDKKVPVSYVTVGPVSKEDVMKAMKAVLSEIPERRKKEYSCMLVFDIKVLGDAQKYAQENEIKIFTANIIYHLTDFFFKYVEECKAARREKEGKEAVFPCVLKQVAVFHKNDPIVLGVDVQAGVLKIGTPIAVFYEKGKGDKQMKIGTVESIEHNHKKLKQARKITGSVAISIGGDPSISVGRQFEQKDKLVSLISRRSIDCLKEHYKEEVTKEEWQLVIELKKYFGIN